MRQKSQFVIAFGSCAHTGGIPAMANEFDREKILKYVYEDAPTVVNEDKTRPQTTYKENGFTATLPEFRNVVRALDQVIDVDFYLPGCPPTPKLISSAVQALLSGELPPKGSVLAPDIALCDECPRKDSKPTNLSFEQFKRPHQIKIDPELCMLAQGLVCMGPATRGGCEAQCTMGNMPCTGCFGPTSRVKDQGAKILSSIMANIAAEDEEEIEKTLDTLPDPIGTFYRYGMASSILRRKVNLAATAKEAQQTWMNK